jgi:hypothetical protein
MDYIHKFNVTFNEFIDDIIRIFPNDQDLKVYKAGIQTAIVLDNKYIITRFNDSIVDKYGKQLLERNDAFFLNHDYTDVISYNKEYNAVILKVKNAWSSMNTENKEIMWKYFKILILLSNKFVLKEYE